ncbi:hypothetical protein FKW77_004450 [Venturia effusa]|uniref:Uncharacterized protein n=1 Tax=Venturia effusa TaxID=50376 RepID=A0A517LDM5_9PEZI|nr:hypothetical protein FKW77_004450 [Venturia effusa]
MSSACSLANTDFSAKLKALLEIELEARQEDVSRLSSPPDAPIARRNASAARDASFASIVCANDRGLSPLGEDCSHITSLPASTNSRSTDLGATSIGRNFSVNQISRAQLDSNATASLPSPDTSLFSRSAVPPRTEGETCQFSNSNSSTKSSLTTTFYEGLVAQILDRVYESEEVFAETDEQDDCATIVLEDLDDVDRTSDPGNINEPTFRRIHAFKVSGQSLLTSLICGRDHQNLSPASPARPITLDTADADGVAPNPETVRQRMLSTEREPLLQEFRGRQNDQFTTNPALEHTDLDTTEFEIFLGKTQPGPIFWATRDTKTVNSWNGQLRSWLQNHHEQGW